MIALIQRVSFASVSIEGEVCGEIGPGLLALIGVQQDDTIEKSVQLAEKMLNYRVFGDDKGRMNLSVRDVNGGVLLVSQFTLAADTNKGTRPSFSSAAAPKVAQTLFENLVTHVSATDLRYATGRFGADMQISLTNDGPVTFWLET